jgi:hypothetical protein
MFVTRLEQLDSGTGFLNNVNSADLGRSIYTGLSCHTLGVWISREKQFVEIGGYRVFSRNVMKALKD